MEIPAYFAQRPMETSRLPRAPAAELADVGGELSGRGLEAVGQGMQQGAFRLAQIQRRFMEVEGNSQFDTARRQAHERINQLTLELQDNQDPASYKKVYESALSNIKAFTPKNELGARKFESWKQYHQPEWEMGVTQAQRKVVKLNAQVAYHANLAGIGSLKTREEAEAEARTLTQGALDDGVRTPAQAAADYQSAMEVWIRRDAWDTAIGLGHEEGVKWLSDLNNAPNLQRPDRNEMIASLRRLDKAKEAYDVETLENQRKTDRQGILDKFLKREFTDIESFINGSSLDAPEKLQWIEKAEKRADAIVGGKDNPFEQTDPETYFELRRKIADNPESVSEDELASYVGKGLEGGISVNDYEKLLGMVTDTTNPLNQPAAKRHQSILKSLFNAGLLGDKTKLETTVKYQQLANQADEFFKDDRTSQETEAFLKQQIEATERRYVELLLKAGRLWVSTKIGEKLTTRYFGKEPEYLLVDSSEEPQTEDEFYDTVKAFGKGSKEQQEYYERWKNIW